MNEVNEIKIPKWVESISVTQHDDKVVIKFMPKERKFKKGDFVYEDGRIMIIKSYPNMYHALVFPLLDDKACYDTTYGVNFSSPTFRYATEEEKQLLIDALAEDGKRWNAEKLEIEDIPKRKFKAGDKVALKSGCTTSKSNLIYRSSFDEYIGKELIVIDYTESGNVKCNNGFRFAEDWLELYVEKQQPKFKAGDKVKIKDGISSKTHGKAGPHFTRWMDGFIGKELTVEGHRNGFVLINEDYYKCFFDEDWLEPWSDEPKNGDLAIFWDNGDVDNATIRLYDKKGMNTTVTVLIPVGTMLSNLNPRSNLKKY